MKKKDLLTDYCLSFLLKIAGPVFRALPMAAGFFIARRLGDLVYVCDLRHRARVYAHIRQAVGGLPPGELRRITRRFFQAYLQDLIEIFFIPRVDKQYLEKYVAIEGLEHVRQAFKQGRGVIFAAVHAGGGELSNAVCANLGFPFRLFVRAQKLPRVEAVLNAYRRAQGSGFIQREKQLRELFNVLKANESVVMTVDQGGRKGQCVPFFGRSASMASGALRIAMKSGAALIPVFPIRIRGPYVKFMVEPAFTFSRSDDFEADVRANLLRLLKVFESYILRYPHEYFWIYKIWKYSDQARILILSDGKTGHLRQSQALAQIVSDQLKEQGVAAQFSTQEIRFRAPFSSKALIAGHCLSGRFICQGCLVCLKACLDKNNLAQLLSLRPDIVISCGSSLVAVNRLLSTENQARSCVIMRPSIFSTRRFDLVVMPRHDGPPRRRNVAVIDGALNLIDEAYLAREKEAFCAACGIASDEPGIGVGVLIGGDTRDFRLSVPDVEEALAQLKSFCAMQKGRIFATTSRRTSPAVEEAVRAQLKRDPRTKALIIANEKNISSAVGGILGLSRMVVVTPESISMVSEAATSSAYVFVLGSESLRGRHRRFLNNLRKGGYIYLVEPAGLQAAMEKVAKDMPARRALSDRDSVREKLRDIL